MGGLIGRGAKGFVYFAKRSVPVWFPEHGNESSRNVSREGIRAPAGSWRVKEQAVAIKVFGVGGIGWAAKEIKVYRVSCPWFTPLLWHRDVLFQTVMLHHLTLFVWARVILN